MRGDIKINIVISLLIVISFILTSTSVMGRPTLSNEMVTVDNTTAIAEKATLGIIRHGEGNPLISLQDGPYPVDVTAISFDGVNLVNDDDDIIASGTYRLDVTVCRTEYDLEDQVCHELPAEVKMFISVFKQKIISGEDPDEELLYEEDFEDPCEIAENWQTIDVPICCGSIDAWTWIDNRYCSPSHSMHSTSFEQYLPNQYDILELNFNGAGFNVSGNSGLQICWCQFVEGDLGAYLQDYGFFEYSFDYVTWTQAGVNYYDSGGITETICLTIDLNATNPADDTIWFRWTWVSDAIFCYEGWYIDDVVITGLIGGTADIVTWEFVMDSYSYPTLIPGECIEYVFNESWVAKNGLYRICAWSQVLDDCHYSSTEYSNPYCTYMKVVGIIPENLPPAIPKNPHPSNGAIDVDINTDLSWTSGDPDWGDTVTYDVFFGSMPPLTKLASNISTTSLNTGILANSLTYFWNVVAWDNHGLSSQGPVWHFTTINAINIPPNKPSTPVGETNGKINVEYTYTTSTTDPGQEQVYYLWDWGDGNTSGWRGPYYSGVTVGVIHTWTAKGSYSIKVKAKDSYGAESDWSDPLPITMPYSYNPMHQFFEWLFERFPNAFPILWYLFMN